MISHEHRCIFVHIPKTAGTSIYTFFYPNVEFNFKEPDYERLYGWCPKRQFHMQHATARELVETGLVTLEQWNSYFKFAFVRNPWDRAYSDYLWMQRIQRVRGKFEDYLDRSGVFARRLNDGAGVYYLGNHLTPQSEFFDDEGIYSMDFVGRFENFDRDIHEVLHKLGIDRPFDIRKNKSRRRKDYSKFYTNSRMKQVAQLFQQDIERFGYRFEDKRTGVYSLKRLF